MNDIKTWQERAKGKVLPEVRRFITDAAWAEICAPEMMAEIAELRSALAARATPAQSVLDQAEFERQATYQGGFDFTLAPKGVCENGWFPATYRHVMIEMAWRVWANKRATNAAQWISVKDQLPEKYTEVLVWPWIDDYTLTAERDDSGFYYGEYIHNYGHENVRLHDGRVTHWMPLPAAPSIAQDGQKSEGDRGD